MMIIIIVIIIVIVVIIVIIIIIIIIFITIITILIITIINPFMIGYLGYNSPSTINDDDDDENSASQLISPKWYEKLEGGSQTPIDRIPRNTLLRDWIRVANFYLRMGFEPAAWRFYPECGSIISISGMSPPSLFIVPTLENVSLWTCCLSRQFDGWMRFPDIYAIISGNLSWLLKMAQS